MLIQPYQRDELKFAYCYRVYLRWRTYRSQPRQALAKLDQPALQAVADRFGIHILECASNPTDVLTLVSLCPTESMASCASKLKGQTSRWLREALQLAEPQDVLSRGYFACTTGKSTREAVEQYLSRQDDHHGYTRLDLPPLYVQQWELTSEDEARVAANHAATLLQFHIVLATWGRRGVFGAEESRRVAEHWRSLQSDWRAALRKVSFARDHVHLAVRVHPSVAPADLVIALANSAQEVLFRDFPESVIRAKLERLWQPSAYLGSYGELASPQIVKYLEAWRNDQP